MVKSYKKLKTHMDLTRLRNYREETLSEKSKAFVKDCSNAFQINKDDIFELIKSDELRDKEAKREDVQFLKDAFSGKVVKVISGVDKSFKQAAEEKEERLRELSEKLRKEQELKQKKYEKEAQEEHELAQRAKDFENDFSSGTSGTDSDQEYEPSAKKTRKVSGDTKIALNLSLDGILKEWVPSLTRYQTGSRCEAALINKLYEVGGVDTDLMATSRSTLRRKKFKILESEAEIVREDNLDKIRDLQLIIHFDTKLVRQYRETSKITEVRERISISVSSPEAECLDILLGVLDIDSSKGEDQALAIQSILENYDLVKQIIGACADTTGSNTGRYKGAIVSIIKYALDSAILWLLCR